MKILVISGFLGAGKTTFIKEFVKKTHRDFCILENEYGAINIDKDILKGDDKNLNVYELTEGCICCSSKGEFASSVLTIANTIDPDYLIIEPTGVGYLSSILKNLDKIKYQNIEILEPITIVDASYLLNHYKNFNEILIDQIESTNKIILSKSEKLNEDEKKLINESVHSINKEAALYIDHYSKYNEDFFFSLLKTKSELETSDRKINPDNEIDELGISDFSLSSEMQLISLLEDITRGFYGDIYRAKGFIKLNKYSLKFDLVDTRYVIEVDEDNNPSKAVFIGKNLNKSNLRKRLIKLEPKFRNKKFDLKKALRNRAL